MVTRQEHPQVLDGWPAASVVEIDNVQLVASDENVAGMKVSVKPKLAEWLRSCETVFDTREHQLSDALISRAQIFRYEVIFEQVIAGGDSVALDVDRWPVGKLVRFADKMNSRDETSQLLQQVEVVEIG